MPGFDLKSSTRFAVGVSKKETSVTLPPAADTTVTLPPAPEPTTPVESLKGAELADALNLKEAKKYSPGNFEDQQALNFKEQTSRVFKRLVELGEFNLAGKFVDVVAPPDSISFERWCEARAELGEELLKSGVILDDDEIETGVAFAEISGSARPADALPNVSPDEDTGLDLLFSKEEIRGVAAVNVFKEKARSDLLTAYTFGHQAFSPEGVSPEDQEINLSNETTHLVLNKFYKETIERMDTELRRIESAPEIDFSEKGASEFLSDVVSVSESRGEDLKRIAGNMLIRRAIGDGEKGYEETESFALDRFEKLSPGFTEELENSAKRLEGAIGRAAQFGEPKLSKEQFKELLSIRHSRYEIPAPFVSKLRSFFKEVDVEAQPLEARLSDEVRKGATREYETAGVEMMEKIRDAKSLFAGQDRGRDTFLEGLLGRTNDENSSGTDEDGE